MKYYKHFAESVEGEGVVFFEVCDNLVTRQVEIYNEKRYWADRESQKSLQFMLADRFASEISLQKEHEVTQDQFEAVWRLARHAPA